MASINGDWFHSRSSSNLGELLAVRTLVIESQKLEYIGFGWSGGRQGNQRMYCCWNLEYGSRQNFGIYAHQVL